MGPSAGYEPVSCIFILAWLMELSPVHGQEDVAPPARGDESRTTNSSFMQAGKMCPWSAEVKLDVCFLPGESEGGGEVVKKPMVRAAD